MSKILQGEAIPCSELSKDQIKDLFVLFNEYYEASFSIFQRDLSKKNWIILLKDSISKSIQGFSSLAFYKSNMNSKEIGVVFSGDTIIRPAYWGTPELPRTWIRSVLEIGETLPKPLYWLLISSGYKTYRFLKVFFKEFYPRYDQPTPPDIQATINHLATERFGLDYDPGLGLVRFTSGATPLREDVAEVTERRLKDPNVAFFVKENPGHSQGDELVCFAKIHPENYTAAMRWMLR